MSHPSPQELHEIAYGLSARPPHVEQCGQCREDLESIDAERAGLRGILRDDVAAPRGKPAGRMLSVAAAALLLGLLAFFMWRPDTTSPTRPADETGPLLDRIEQLTGEITRLELEIYQLEQTIQATRNLLDPEWWKKQRK
jgi:hypothetical protein